MSHRYRDGLLTFAQIHDADLKALQELACSVVRRYREAFERFEVQNAIEAVWELVTTANALVEQKAPWQLARQPEHANLLDAVLYALAETARLLSLMMGPVIPRSSARILEQLQATELRGLNWGGLPSNHHLGTPSPIFPKVA
jgi:methionyl-tRNA synthetase